MSGSTRFLPALLFLATGCGSRSRLLETAAFDDPSGSSTSSGGSTTTTSSATRTLTTSSSGSTTTSEGGSGGSGGGTASGGSGGSGGGGAVGDDFLISLSPGTEYEVSPELRVTKSGKIAVVWLAQGKSPSKNFVGYSFSTDQGVTFSAPQLLDEPMGIRATTALLAITPDDETLVAWGAVDLIDAEGCDCAKFVSVARTAPGGTTFGASKLAIKTHNAEELTLTGLGVTAAGTAMLFFNQFNYQAMVAIDTGAEPWPQKDLPENFLTDPGTRYPVPCQFVGSQPSSFFVAHTSKTGVSGILMTNDEGQTWSPVAAYPETLLAPTCVLTGEKLYLAGLWPGSLHLRAGTLQSSEAWALDKDTFSFQYQFHYLNMAVDPAGDIHLATFVTASGYPGVHVFRTLRQAASPGSPVTNPYGNNTIQADTWPESPTFVGRRAGLAADSGWLYMAYTDNSSGKSHIRFHRMPIP